MAIGQETFTADNLVTATQKLITRKDLQLKAGESVVRGEALKLDGTTLVAITATTDVVFTFALQTIDATAGELDISYVYQGSLLASEVTFAVGAIADFRVGIKASTNILIEE